MRKTAEFVDCLADLIRTPSVSSVDPRHDQSNLDVINLLANYFESLDFAVEVTAVPTAHEKYNLVARREHDGVEPAQGLVLSGHTDTVPYDLESWDSDPFTLTERDNHYYGLGTADMKSFFPIVLETLERHSATRFRRPLTVIATADEESSMSGARAFRDADKMPGRYCLIGEPTGLVPRHMHKGVIIETVTIEGRAGHSSDPGLGNSALEGMNKVMNALRQWREELQAQYHNTAFKIPVPTLNLGRIQGGDSANRICARCELSFDLRMLPDMQLEEMKQTIRQRVKATLDGSGLGVTFSDVFDGIPAMQTAANSELVQQCEILTGNKANSVAFATEGPFFNDMGMETVILGPGDIELAHQANEYLQIERIEPMIEIVSKLLMHFCGEQR